MDDNYTPWSGPTQPLAHKQHASHKNVVSLTETHKMRKPLLTSSLAKMRLNVEEILKKNWSCLFMEAYFIISFCKNVLKQ